MPGEIDQSSVKQCEKCAAPKIKISGVLSCVNCSTYVDKESQYRNNIEDPGHEKMMKVLAGAKVDDVPEMIPVKTVELRHSPAYTVPNKSEPTSDDVNQAIETISRFFAKRPVSDLAEAKRLIKLRKEIETLQAKILVFLGQ